MGKIVNRNRERERNLNRSGSMNEHNELNKIANVKSSLGEINQRSIPSDNRHSRRLPLQSLCTPKPRARKLFILARPNFIATKRRRSGLVLSNGPGPTTMKLGLFAQMAAQPTSILGLSSNGPCTSIGH